MKIFRIALIGVLGLLVTPLMAQNEEPTFTLQEAYQKIKKNYPSAEKIEIRQKIAGFNQQLNQSNWLPNIIVGASTSYQSDVTEVPFTAPGTSSPGFSKDHYSISIDVNQSIFDGGRVGALKKIETSNEKATLAMVDVELHNVRAQIDGLFFGIILLKKQQESLSLMVNDIAEQLKLVQSRVKNGVLLPGNELVLKAELLKLEQQQIELKSSVKSGYEALGLILGTDFKNKPDLSYPDLEELDTLNEVSIHRAELELFKAKSTMLEESKGLLKADKLPTLSAFAKTAYARPGLNAFDDDMQLYWMVGLKAQWSFRNWHNASKKNEILLLEQRSIEVEENAFTLQLEASLTHLLERIRSLEKQIELDKSIVELRKQVVCEKKSLLENGVITSTEWLTELNAEHRARLNLEAHQTELVKTNIEYLTKKGIVWN